MNHVEKAERLSQSANVTYDEAVDALDACDQDLLDAVLMLEKQGKTTQPEQSIYSTSFKAQDEYIDVPERVEQQKNEAPTLGKSLAGMFHAIVRFIRNTAFIISRNGEDIFEFPSWIMVLLLLIFWKIALILIPAALLFGFRFSFDGSENTNTANSVLSKAGKLADDVKAEFQKARKREKER